MPTMPKKFTLIELLVVIAIIAVLASILLPALNKTMEKGRSISCVNNLKQLGIAMLMYTDDYDNFFPIKAAGAEHRFCWSRLIAEPYFNITFSTGGNPKTSTKAFHCPSGRIGSSEVNQTASRGYAMNG